MMEGLAEESPVQQKDDGKIKKGRWTKHEDERLRQGVATLGMDAWKQIASEYLGNQRSDIQCLHRWQKVLQPGLVKGTWTKEEDQIIIECIEAGIIKWSDIADRIPGRIGKQARERWFNHLDPTIKKGGWTEEEDAILTEAQARWGNSWTKIARLLPGRAENTIKNRWNSASRRHKVIDEVQQESHLAVARQQVEEMEASDLELARQKAEGLLPKDSIEEEDKACVPRAAAAMLREAREARGEKPIEVAPSIVPSKLTPNTTTPSRHDDMDSDTSPPRNSPAFPDVHPSASHLFEDPNLSAKEKELMHVAYRAGLKRSKSALKRELPKVLENKPWVKRRRRTKQQMEADRGAAEESNESSDDANPYKRHYHRLGRATS